MRNGLYKISFTSQNIGGVGLVVLRDGDILGGDPLLFYKGSYAVENGRGKATISTDRHAGPTDGPSAFGLDRVTIHLDVEVDGDTGRFTGTSLEAAGVNLQGMLQFVTS